jgi:hypothetical protein
MSNLAKRVQKSKSLKFNRFGAQLGYGTLTHNESRHYQVYLTKARETSPVGNGSITHDTLTAKCIHCNNPHQDSNGKWQVTSDCPGNSHHTVCYHSLGAIRHHLSLHDSVIAFCENIFDAIKLRKPGQTLVKIVSGQGKGVLWGVVTVNKEVTLEERVNLLRGTEAEQNGID